MAKDKNVKATGAAQRQLPNGWVMEEATEEKGEWAVESVWGTRLYAKTRFWLVKFVGYPRLQWIPQNHCGCDGAIADFKAYMGWDAPPKEANVELIHPDLMTAEKKATAKPKAGTAAAAASSSSAEKKTTAKKEEGKQSASGGLKRAAESKQLTGKKQKIDASAKSNKKQKVDAPAKSLRALRSTAAPAAKTK
ncbi:hypothetical protein AAVH_09043 [Aphelenchoides avenae]|nr:hypothetical protein AAVH_09043 [Aphelenchus avenae]